MACLNVNYIYREHRVLLKGDPNSKRYKRARIHTKEFVSWLKEKVAEMNNVSRELEVLALGPQRTAKRFSGYVVNGYRFHTRSRDSRCTTQNSGVFLTAETTSFASSKDEKPIVGNVSYYGAIEEIIEVDYWGEFVVVLFRCCWYQEEKDAYGLTRVNFSRLCHKNDPYVLASQVHQVFYIEDPTEKSINYVIKKLPRDWCDNENDIASEEHTDDIAVNDANIAVVPHNDVTVNNWCREDVPTSQFPI